MLGKPSSTVTKLTPGPAKASNAVPQGQAGGQFRNGELMSCMSRSASQRYAQRTDSQHDSRNEPGGMGSSLLPGIASEMSLSLIAWYRARNVSCRNARARHPMPGRRGSGFVATTRLEARFRGQRSSVADGTAARDMYEICRHARDGLRRFLPRHPPPSAPASTANPRLLYRLTPRLIPVGSNLILQTAARNTPWVQ